MEMRRRDDLHRNGSRVGFSKSTGGGGAEIAVKIDVGWKVECNHIHTCLMESKILKNAENARKSKKILGTARHRVKASYTLQTDPE